MSLDRKAPAPMAGTQETPLPVPVPRLVQVRQTLSQPVFAAFLAGGFAGAVSRTVVSPLERLKILYQVQSVGRDEYKMSVGRGLMKMWKEEGWRGFMRGNGANCLRIVPYSAVQFGSYNFYKRVRRQAEFLLELLSQLNCLFYSLSRVPPAQIYRHSADSCAGLALA
jgi:solute carrier family 25 phosphate transporter 23/24/25/41